MLKKKRRLQPVAKLVVTVGVETSLDVSSQFGALRPGFSQRLIWQVCDWRGLPQSWRQKLRKRFARKVVGPFDASHKGMNFRLYPAENYCDRVLFGRNDLPERAEHDALLPYIKPGMVFVDIGANVGTYSVFVGTKAKGDATLLAFEPHPRTYQKLCFNLAANGLSGEHVLNAGVDGARGEVELWSDGGSNIGHTSMLKQGTAHAKVSVKVPVLPLLDVMVERGIENIDLLKIDIEGYEDRALAPFFDTAHHALLPNQILIEVAHQHLWEHDLMSTLTELGFVETFRTPENRLLSRV